MENEKIKPQLLLAYDIAIKSYDWILNRTDAMDTAIDRLLAWTSGINIGVVAIIAKEIKGTSFCSPWFICSIIAFLVCIALGVTAKAKGELKMLSPRTIRDSGSLDDEEFEFRMNVLDTAAEDFSENRDYVNSKARFGMGMMAMLIINIVSMGIWLIHSL